MLNTFFALIKRNLKWKLKSKSTILEIILPVLFIDFFCKYINFKLLKYKLK